MPEIAPDLLFELGCEELPPKSLLTLRNALRDRVRTGLDQAGLAHREINAYAAPRRLAVLIHELAPTQPDKTIERRGPTLKAAYTASGEPAPALTGFLHSCGATLADLRVLKTGKGEWVTVTQRIQGAATTELIAAILRDALAALPIAKHMRWGAGDAEFVRPVHWAVLLYGDTVIDTTFYGVTTGRATRGHRFHHPEPIELATPADYTVRLRSPGYVLADFDARRERVHAAVQRAAQEADGTPIFDAELLAEVTALVDWPVPIVGGFDPRFLDVPREALIATMQGNQKYFPLEDRAGHLLPRFITIANIDSHNPAAVRAGNERVVRPRLADAQFFWEQDKQRGLDHMASDLVAVVFQERLGTLAQKTGRVEWIVEAIGQQCGINPALIERAERAAKLFKADLRSAMVGEFPELQGTMGRYYALVQGEHPDTAAAIEEHYFPRQSGGPLPVSTAGQLLAMADKIDTLAGIFCIGLIPTGDKDPYGLRRAALGLVRVVLECGYDVELRKLFEQALERYDGVLGSALATAEQAAKSPGELLDRPAALEQVLVFVLERMRGYCLERGVTPDEWDAVTAVASSNLMDIQARLAAVRAFRQLPEADSLAAANKRIRNILRKCEATEIGPVDPALFVDLQETALHAAAVAADRAVAPQLANRDYAGALQHLAALRDAVDAFFDHVLVNAEDTAVRCNRFALLAQVEGLFLRIADVGRLQPAQAAP